jgi:hypothetical protein
MIQRLIIFQVLLLAGLSGIFLLPKSPPMQEAALNMRLPSVLTLTGWTGDELQEDGSAEEKAILAPDTEYAKRTYRREVPPSEQGEKYYPGLVDELRTGIVLSGKSLSGSIHALERCLGAQGFNIPEASTMKIKLRSGHILPVRRLVCEKVIPETNYVARSIAYYWFVGHSHVTSNHIQRGIRDLRDRFIEGYDQRWGYLTVTAQLDGERLRKLDPAVKLPLVLKKGEQPPTVPIKSSSGFELIRRPITHAQADQLVEEFIGDLGPDIIAVDQIKDWPDE